MDLDINQIIKADEEDMDMSCFFQTPRKRGRPRKYPLEVKPDPCDAVEPKLVIQEDIIAVSIPSTSATCTPAKSRANLSKKGRKGFQRTPKPPKPKKPVCFFLNFPFRAFT